MGFVFTEQVDLLHTVLTEEHRRSQSEFLVAYFKMNNAKKHLS